mmetsp:Transcript_16917/g.59098  ORF Transcript_16917/g.59098 Transcript_16917/m.59098 type:complete len:242 (-) Transcript_16917:464-1189(-)
MLADPMGVSSKKLKMCSNGRPKASETIRRTSGPGRGGTAFWSFFSSFVNMSGSTPSGRSDSNWPSLTNTPPKSASNENTSGAYFSCNLRKASDLWSSDKHAYLAHHASTLYSKMRGPNSAQHLARRRTAMPASPKAIVPVSNTTVYATMATRAAASLLAAMTAMISRQNHIVRCMNLTTLLPTWPSLNGKAKRYHVHNAARHEAGAAMTTVRCTEPSAFTNNTPLATIPCGCKHRNPSTVR